MIAGVILLIWAHRKRLPQTGISEAVYAGVEAEGEYAQDEGTAIEDHYLDEAYPGQPASVDAPDTCEPGEDRPGSEQAPAFAPDEQTTKASDEE